MKINWQTERGVFDRQTIREIKLQDIKEREQVGLLTPAEAAELRHKV